MKKNSKGFTLIELMIVVAIIGIIAAVAVPQYQNYVIRSQTSRVMYESAQLRVAIENCLNNGLSTLGVGGQQCNPDAAISNLMDKTLGNSGYDSGGVVRLGTPVITSPLSLTTKVTVYFGNRAASPLASQTLTWTRNSNGSWKCSTTVLTKYRPSGCS